MATMTHWCAPCGGVVKSWATFGGTDHEGRSLVAVWTDAAGHIIEVKVPESWNAGPR